MHGNPPLRLALVALVFIFAGLLVAHVTGDDFSRPVPATSSTTPTATTNPQPQLFQLQIHFVNPPLNFEVQHLGKTIMEGKGPALVFQKEIPLALPREGIELVLRANWPAKIPMTAVRLECRSEGETISDRTFWSNGALAEVILVR